MFACVFTCIFKAHVRVHEAKGMVSKSPLTLAVRTFLHATLYFIANLPTVLGDRFWIHRPVSVKVTDFSWPTLPYCSRWLQKEKPHCCGASKGKLQEGMQELQFPGPLGSRRKQEGYKKSAGEEAWRTEERRPNITFSSQRNIIFALTIGLCANDRFQFTLCWKNKLGVQLNFINRKFKVVTGAQRAFQRAAELNRDE